MIPLAALTDKLEELPSLIARVAFKAEEARKAFEETKCALERLEAKTYLTIKARSPNMIATEIKEMVKDNADVYKGKMLAIEAESVFKNLQIQQEEMNNQFTGLKIIARIKMQEMQSVD